MKIKLRKERDKNDARNITLQFSFSQFLMIQLVLLITSTTSSHIPMTFDPAGAASNSSDPADEVIASSISAPINLNQPFHLAALTPRREPSFNATCSDSVMTIMATFDEPFKGRIYANDYSDEDECGVVKATDPSENVILRLPLGQCGTQMTVLDNNVDSELLHEVNLYIQYSALLQQMADERVTVFCLETKRTGDDDNEQKGEADGILPVNSRQGRRMKNSGGHVGLPKVNSGIGEATMEIIGGKDPSPKSKKTLPVAVGEYVTLVISTRILRGFDARIVNCTTHDGSRSSSSDGIRNQPIMDSAGCSVDKGLVPNFRRRRLPVESRNRLITLHFSSFQAFKFPDRDHLHIQCTVAYCQGPCPQEVCESSSNHYGTWREKYGRIADVLMETSHVVNSIEVLSPDLDSPGGEQFERRKLSPTLGTASVDVPDNAHHLSTNEASPQPPPTHYSKNPSTSFPQHFNNNDKKKTPYAINNLTPQRQIRVPATEAPPAASNGRVSENNVCISPGTVIIALVVLGLVLVVSITSTLWFALKRSEVKKYSEGPHKSAFSNPTPAPYYRFSHW